METVSIAQGSYFVLTGAWPIVSIRTFQMVTGPKKDLWLVKTVGALVAVVGLVMIIAGLRENVSFEIFLLAVGSAGALMIIDLNYVWKRTIAPIYLLDAAIEIVVIVLWFAIDRVPAQESASLLF